jgi:hypothetical protein
LIVFQWLNVNNSDNYGSHFKGWKLSTSKWRVIHEEDLPYACHQGPRRKNYKSKVMGGREGRLASTAGGSLQSSLSGA